MIHQSIFRLIYSNVHIWFISNVKCCTRQLKRKKKKKHLSTKSDKSVNLKSFINQTTFFLLKLKFVYSGLFSDLGSEEKFFVFEHT